MLFFPKVDKTSSLSSVANKVKKIVASVLTVGSFAVGLASIPTASFADTVSIASPLLMVQADQLGGPAYHSSHYSHSSHSSHHSHYSSRW